MNAHEAEVLARLRSMSLSDARLAVARKEFGAPPDSPDYLFACGVLAALEAAERDAREEKTLAISRSALEGSQRANSVATIAMICATVATISAAIIGAIIGSFIGSFIGRP